MTSPVLFSELQVRPLLICEIVTISVDPKGLIIVLELVSVSGASTMSFIGS